MAVLSALLIPSLLNYSEKSRAQRDAAMDEITSAVLLGLANEDVYNEVLANSVYNNVSCYIDKRLEAGYNKIITKAASPGTIRQYTFDSSTRTADLTPYYAAGNMRGMTITFEPEYNGNDSYYVLRNAVVNKFTERAANKRLGTLSANSYIYHYVRKVAGDKIDQDSQTYKNSDYTIFIRLGARGNYEEVVQEPNHVEGQYSGANLFKYPSYYETEDREIGDPNEDIYNPGEWPDEEYPFVPPDDDDEEQDNGVAMLAPGDTWYTGETPRSSITRIKILSSYTRTRDEIEYWPAAVDSDNDGELDDDIMCYVNGTELIIVGDNGQGKIWTNPNSSFAFSDEDKIDYFRNLKTITNANKLDTSKTTNMSAMFQDAAKLYSVDVSKWDTSSATDMTGMFYGMNRLEKVTLGDGFAFVGTDGYLPTPDAAYITGADGKWYDISTGTGYTPANVPSNKAAQGFSGYNTPASQNVVWDSTTAKTITFQYTPTSYNITINCNGGSGVDSRSYTIETATFTLGTPTRSGYTFTGWTGSNGSTPQKTVTITKGSIGAKSYTANWEINNTLPDFTYTGSYEIVDENNNVISTTTSGNWKIRFLTSGKLTFHRLGSAANGIDAFVVGGGGGGAKYSAHSGGGGGGYTKTKNGIAVEVEKEYSITIGSGGAGGTDSDVNASSGTASKAFNLTANGGSGGGGGGYMVGPLHGGSGGSGGGSGYCAGHAEMASSSAGLGGTDGNGGKGTYPGSGQGTTTREFAETDGKLYAEGGDGSNSGGNMRAGGANTGNGGAGGGYKGGSGIVIIRPSNTNPYFSYTGNYEIVDSSGNQINSLTGNWKVRFLTSGTLTFHDLANATNGIDAFLVGGGGGGTNYGDHSGGGGGGYTKTQKCFTIQLNTPYEITVGYGGSGGGTDTAGSGGATKAFGLTANGGSGAGGGGYMVGALKGGNGGSGGGAGYSYGHAEMSSSTAGLGGTDGNGGRGSFPGTGQGRTTREFEEASGALYAEGGDGSKSGGNMRNGAANTGNGGAGGSYSGGSGIVIIRPSTTNSYFTYTGSYEITDDNGNPVSSLSGNWKVRFLTSGTLTFNNLGNATNGIDVFSVGGGGGTASYGDHNGGGGGGYTKTQKNVAIAKNTQYVITVGNGGSSGSNGAGGDGGSTSAFGVTAAGGKGGGGGGTMIGTLKGGNGGSGGGAGYSYGHEEMSSSTAGKGGTNGASGGGSYPGTGQGTTTREFGESSGTLYSKGGDGSTVSGGTFANGALNTGNGGAGGGYSGGSGIVIIRNKR